MKDLKYLLAYTIPLSAVLALLWQGWWSWATVILAFGIFPLLDAIFPASTANYSESEEKSRLSNRFFDMLLYICAHTCFVLVYFYFKTIQTGGLATYEWLGLTFSIGVVLGALGINVAHELGHRANKWEQFLAKAGLLTVLYQHFFIEHNRGHHKHVSTDKDPATARKNEWVYAFFFRSIIGQYISAWQLENDRLRKKGLSLFSWENEMIRFSVYQTMYLSAVVILFGWTMLPYALAIALIGVLLLETINYIEHYGLRRKILPNGRPERVLPKHSWNSDHEMGRIVLFELTRHSDHHYLASRKYQILRHMEESPQLPTGYPGSMLMALAPPLWFFVMNKRLEDQARQLELA
ncbi:alkane 1-monooxygenase [Cecembia rubra]|uniref:alkane 1-monooxygenase n=1 Tax=Cecembia rubra TaxID=1485585 RepID=UPI002714BF42|nr:alkane 1-monooxygenase [Cecembia rubra]